MVDLCVRERERERERDEKWGVQLRRQLLLTGLGGQFQLQNMTLFNKAQVLKDF